MSFLLGRIVSQDLQTLGLRLGSEFASTFEHAGSIASSSSAASGLSFFILFRGLFFDARTLLLTAFLYLGRTPYVVGDDQSRKGPGDNGNLAHCGHHHGFMFGVSPSNAAADDAAPPPTLRYVKRGSVYDGRSGIVSAISPWSRGERQGPGIVRAPIG